VVVVWPRAGRNYRGCGVALLLGELRRLDPVDGGHGDSGRGQERPRGDLERGHGRRGGRQRGHDGGRKRQGVGGVEQQVD